MSLDPACHAECLEFIRVAIAEAFRTTAHEITAVLKEVCTEGHADLSAIWRDLTATERQQFQTLLAPSVIAREAGQKNPRGDRLPVPRCGLRHRERVERGDRHGPAYSNRCFGGCWRNRIYPVQADYRMNQA
jgi:hypothetical protein